MPFDEVKNCARLLKVNRKLLANSSVDDSSIVELEKVINDLCVDYEDRTGECLLTLAQKALRT